MAAAVSSLLLLIVPGLLSAAALFTDLERTEGSGEDTGCPPLPTFQQDTESTKAAIIGFNPPMAEGLKETNFMCEPAPGTNLTMVTSFSAFFGGDPMHYVSPANKRWSLTLHCHEQLHYWYWQELIEDIMYHVKFYKIRCNSFLLTAADQMDKIGKELENTPFP